MTIPAMGPSGAMASGAYVDYMIGYMQTALTGLEAEVETYVADKTVTDWYDKWTEILDDTEARITTLNSDISKIKAQILMLTNAIDAL